MDSCDCICEATRLRQVCSESQCPSHMPHFHILSHTIDWVISAHNKTETAPWDHSCRLRWWQSPSARWYVSGTTRLDLSQKGIQRKLGIRRCSPPEYPPTRYSGVTVGSGSAHGRVDSGGMQYQTLGDSSLRVSRMCLGTMTFGEGNRCGKLAWLT